MTTEPKASFLQRRIKSTQARSILQSFTAALKAVRFYPLEHPSFVDSISAFHQSILSNLSNQGLLVFNRIGQELFFGEIVLVDNSLAQRQMVSELIAQRIFRLTFHEGVTREELTGLIHRLGRESGKGEGLREAWEFWQKQPFPHIEVGIGQPMISEGKGEKREGVPLAAKPDVEKEKRHQAKKIYGEGIKRLSHFLAGIQPHAEVDLEPVNLLAENLAGTAAELDASLLGSTCSRRPGWDTAQHAVNVSILSVCLGKLMGLPPEQLKVLGEAALVHDVGTVMVPMEILGKPSDLTPQEREVFERHPVEGASLLSAVPGINGITLAVTLEHHLHYDGTGYPALPGLASPHPFSQIVALCDFYDAAIHLSQKQESILPAKTVAYMWRKRGSFFDPTLLKIFVQMVGIFPVGSLVRLDNGSSAFVVANNLDNMQRPWVVLADPGNPTIPLPLSLMNTEDETGQFKLSILDVVSPLQVGLNPLKYLGLTDS
jgi:HD-GYP domain-containing protein (c-di-GMP phosphodiesterase class II)